MKLGGTLYGWGVLLAVLAGGIVIYLAYEKLAVVGKTIARGAEAVGGAIATVKDGAVTVVTHPVQETSAAEREAAGEPSSVYEDLSTSAIP
jgi:hypothetical protein